MAQGPEDVLPHGSHDGDGEPRPGRLHPRYFTVSKVLSWPLGCDLQNDPDHSGQVSEKIIGSK